MGCASTESGASCCPARRAGPSLRSQAIPLFHTLARSYWQRLSADGGQRHCFVRTGGREAEGKVVYPVNLVSAGEFVAPLPVMSRGDRDSLGVLPSKYIEQRVQSQSPNHILSARERFHALARRPVLALLACLK